MKINTSLDRWLHLLALLICSYIGAQALMYYLDWTSLAAYGSAVTVAVQINNALLKMMEEEEKQQQRQLQQQREREDAPEKETSATNASRTKKHQKKKSVLKKE